MSDGIAPACAARGAPDLSMPAMISRRTRIAVCVPVRDEREALPALLDAFARQSADRACFVVGLLFDGCDDGGEAYVQMRQPQLDYSLACARIPRQPEARAGRARRAAMDLGARLLARARRPGDSELLLTTDADSIPAPDWIETSIRALEQADVVAGYIERPDAAPAEMHRRVERYWERLRSLQRTVDPLVHDPAPSHHSQGGASLGFRADVYAALGGFADVASHEDVGLVTAARQAGYRIRHDRNVRVATSSRLRARAADGLADTLRARQATRTMPAVEDPDTALARYRLCAQARQAFDTLDDEAVVHSLAKRSGHSADELRAIAAQCTSAEGFVMRIAPEPANAQDLALDIAEHRLALLETAHQCPHA